MHVAPPKSDLPARILVVEDEIIIAIFVREELRDAGFEVAMHEDAESALMAFKAGEFVAAIIDVGLPGGSGVDLVHHLRQTSNDLPIVVATGADTAPLDAAFRSDRMLCVLPKPYDGTSLLACLKSLHVSSSDDSSGAQNAPRSR